MSVSAARIATTPSTCCLMGIRCARLTQTNAPFLWRGTTGAFGYPFYYGGSVAPIDRHFGPMKRPSTDEMDFLRKGPVDIHLQILWRRNLHGQKVQGSTIASLGRTFGLLVLPQ